MGRLRKMGLVAVTLGIIASGGASLHYFNKAEESAREAGLTSFSDFPHEQEEIYARIKELENNRRETYRNPVLFAEYEEKKWRYCILGKKAEEVRGHLRGSLGYLSANVFLNSLFMMFSKKRRG